MAHNQFGNDGSLGPPQFSPDGSALLAGANDNLAENLYLFSLDGSRARALTNYVGTAKTDGRWAQDAQYSPNGTHIAFRRGSSQETDVVFIDSGGGHDRRVTRALQGKVETPQWMADDVLVTYRNGAFVAIDTSGVPPDSVRVPDSIGHARGMWMNRKEQSLYFATSRNAIAAADFRSHTSREIVRHADPLAVVGWLSSGVLLVTDARRGKGAALGSVFRVDEGGKLTRVASTPSRCYRVSLNRAGTMLACLRETVASDVILASAITPSDRVK